MTRLFRLCAHVTRGWLHLRFSYPYRTRPEQLAMVRTWSQQLLAILGVTPCAVYDSGAPFSACMMVSNHISWLDVFVILAQHPVCFISKAEVGRWPVIGTLAGVTGTLFIERVRRRDAHRIKEMIVHVLDAGDKVCIFPESTTTEGDVLLHFHANLLQAAIDRNVPIYPVALRYQQMDGGRSRAAPYVGEQTLLESLLAILAEPSITAKIRFLEPLSPQGHTRRELARLTEAAISKALGLPVVHIPPASQADLPA